jgi:hypothetical protein
MLCSTKHIPAVASPRRRPIRTATIASAIAFGSAGALLAGCGGTIGLTPSATRQAGATQQQASASAQQAASSTSASSSTSHHKSTPHGHGSAKPRSARAGNATPGQGTQPVSGSVAGAGQPLVPKGPNPCVFVSGAEAQAIIGTPIAGLTEAPLGPTCVFKLKGQRQTITIAVETQKLGTQARYMHRRRKLVLGGHRAYCGILGRSMLDVALGGGRILNITAPCPVAEALAVRALRHIPA